MQQGADNPDAQHGDGQPEGGALPMLYAAREEQQHDPGDARSHAGELDDAEGDPFPDLREPFGADGQDDVEAQDGSDAEHRARHDRGREGPHPAPGVVQHAGFLYGLLADFVDGEDDCGQQQRQQVVDDAETEEGRENGLRRGRGQVQDHDFQHARAAGDVGQHHSYHRHQVGGQELEEGNVRIRGKQDVQAGPRRDEVGPGHHSLSDGDLEGRERELLAEDVDRLMDEFADDQIADGDEEQDGAEGADIQRHMHTQFRRDLRIMKIAPTSPSAPTQKVMASISTSRTMSIGEKPQLE